MSKIFFPPESLDICLHVRVFAGVISRLPTRVGPY